MGRMKKQYSNAFRAKVAFSAIKGDRTVSEICAEYKVASSQVYQWKKTLLEEASSVFGNSKSEKSEDTGKLYEQIGRLQVENNFLKKKCFS